MGAQPDFDVRALFEHLPNAFMVLDRDLRYVAANPAYLALTGGALDQLLGRYLFDLFPDNLADPNSANAANLRASFERVLATGRPDELAAIRYRVPRVSGGPAEERIWSARHTPLLDATGRVTHIVQETTDVTHLSEHLTIVKADVLDRAERSVVTATNLGLELRSLRQMFAQAPGFMTFVRGRDHVFEIVNAAYMQLVGHRDVIGLPVATALPEVVEQGFIRLLDSVFDSGEPFIGNDVPLRLQRHPGADLEDCFVDFVYQPIRGPSNEVIGIFVQGQDVTAQHHAAALAGDARRDLEAAEARLRFLIEAIPVQVWTSSPDGKLDFVSERVVAYFQMSSADILGNGWLAVLHPEDVDACVARWTHSLATGEPYEVEFRLRRGDGMYRWHLGRANAQRGAAGVILGWFGTNTDIHDATIAVAELRARSEYEQRLIGIVSHDLRNPLNAISLAATLLSARNLDDATARTVKRLARAADRATRLINDLLDFAKARIGTTIPINPAPSNLREIVEQVVDEVQMTAPARVIRSIHVGAEDGRWDPDRIAQVLSNLVGNAIQHGPPSAPITIKSRIDGDAAVLAITNAGPAIPDSELAQLFEPFKRGRNASSAGGSMGLGLYIAREVVVAHGGTIEVASDRDGTCFTVRLPRFAV